MKNLNIFSKTVLLFTIIFFTVWLGGYIARQIAVYQLFEPVELNLRTFYYTNNLSSAISLLVPLIISNLITYACFLLLFLTFIVISKLNLRRNGWLFIITLIIIITAPFEIYLSLIDYKIIRLGLANINEVSPIIELIKERITKLSSFSLIEIFSYISIIILVLFKPLQKSNEN
ncbi:MAG: hypothetical protein FIA82_13730 [Melioribacter sp.]|nr:hypothetical protein [Melioribacter sp.]